VLNALRQSEENHKALEHSTSKTLKCSTPYGNQRKITFALLALANRVGMCSTPYGNQRKITQYTEGSIAFGRVCSTPYGNQRKITSVNQSRGKVDEPCSTPYGNQRKITNRRGGIVTSRLVLNALRQSEENHLAPNLEAL